ncbi:MAG: hypothetical protein JW993_12000 [Sedimentisphaerales bacterium]|nr:hypothetical protein [Sedimentisphaerales bacterium]
MEDKQYVIQEHTTPQGVHWDLMLEKDGVLGTFRLEEPPTAASQRTVQARKIFDHPLRFLTYEGPVQQGAGRVRIVDRGHYRDSGQSEMRWDLHLTGAVLAGDFSLTHIEQDAWAFAPRSHPARRGE